MRIGLDLDGPIYPWHYSIYRYFCENKGFDGDIDTFWETRRQDITPYYVSLPFLYLDTTPLADTLKYTFKLAEVGELFYITSRTLDLERVTLKFFDNYHLPFKENLIFDTNKATQVRLNRIDFFLDDLPHNVESLQGITKAYLFKCWHNRNQREGFEVVNTMKEFYEIVTGEKNDK